jgi:hypothetical protein
MKKTIIKFPTAFVGLIIASILVLSASLGNDLVKLDLKFIESIQQHEADDILTAFLIILVSLIIDEIRIARAHRREAETIEAKLRTLKATMRTVQDLVNNCLNGLQLFRLEAEEAVPADSLRMFDCLISETATKINKIADLDWVQEVQQASGPGINYTEPPQRRTRSRAG